MASTDTRLFGLSKPSRGKNVTVIVERPRLGEVERRSARSSPSCTSAIPDHVSRRVRAALVYPADRGVGPVSSKISGGVGTAPVAPTLSS